MRESKTIMVLASLVACGAWAAAYLMLKGAGPALSAGESHDVTGRAMALEAQALLRPPGQLLVLARDTTAFENPASELQWSAFTRAVRKARAPIRVVHRLQLDPLRPVQAPPGDFFEMLRGAHEGDVIVSFVGPPLLTELQRAQLGAIKPSVVAFCSGRLPELVDLKQLFDQGLLHAAVVAKHGRSTSAAAQPMESYITVTRANLADLPAAFSARAE